MVATGKFDDAWLYVLAPIVGAIVVGVSCANSGHATSSSSRDVDIVAMNAQAQDTPKEPRVSAMGSDLSDLPQLYPDGDWLPIDATDPC